MEISLYANDDLLIVSPAGMPAKAIHAGDTMTIPVLTVPLGLVDVKITWEPSQQKVTMTEL